MRAPGRGSPQSPLACNAYRRQCADGGIRVNPTPTWGRTAALRQRSPQQSTLRVVLLGCQEAAATAEGLSARDTARSGGGRQRGQRLSRGVPPPPQRRAPFSPPTHYHSPARPTCRRTSSCPSRAPACLESFQQALVRQLPQQRRSLPHTHSRLSHGFEAHSEGAVRLGQGPTLQLQCWPQRCVQLA